MKVTAFCQQKGGVGKTTIAAGVAERLASAGHRVLVIDMDPQSNLTEQLDVELAEDAPTMADVLYAPPTARGRVEPGVIAEVIVPAGGAWAQLGGVLDVAPAVMALDNREHDQGIGFELRLRTAMSGDELTSRYDHVLIDCRPSLGKLTVNALAAADQVMCVTEPRASSVQGLPWMLDAIELVSQQFGRQVAVAGIVVNKFTPHRGDPVAWAAKLEKTYGSQLVSPFVPERELVSKASTLAVPIAAYPTTPGARAEITDALDAVVARLVAR